LQRAKVEEQKGAETEKFPLPFLHLRSKLVLLFTIHNSRFFRLFPVYCLLFTFYLRFTIHAFFLNLKSGILNRALPRRASTTQLPPKTNSPILDGSALILECGGSTPLWICVEINQAGIKPMRLETSCRRTASCGLHVPPRSNQAHRQLHPRATTQSFLAGAAVVGFHRRATLLHLR
jgi:hypothetical protein